VIGVVVVDVVGDGDVFEGGTQDIADTFSVVTR